jgi:hypothetical protein
MQSIERPMLRALHPILRHQPMLGVNLTVRLQSMLGVAVAGKRCAGPWGPAGPETQEMLTDHIVSGCGAKTIGDW